MLKEKEETKELKETAKREHIRKAMQISAK